MNTEQLAALEAGSPIGVSPPNNYQAYGLHNVDRLTKTQIVIVIGTNHDGTPNELRFNRQTGYQVGGSTTWRRYGLVPIEKAREINAERAAERARDATLSKIKALDWRRASNEVLEQVLALHTAATAKELA